MELLRQLFVEIVIPSAVEAELRQHHSELPSFLRVRPAANRERVSALALELDSGEAEAIVLADELHADLLLVDDREARRVALREGVPIVGLLGVLLRAKREGLIPSMREMVTALEIRANFYVSTEIKDAVCRLAGE